MTALRDALARDGEMPAETAAAMERRLLEAFAAHHAAAEESGGSPHVTAPPAAHSWRRSVAAAAALVVIAGTVEAWRILGGPRQNGGTTQSAPAPAAITRNVQPAPVVDVVPDRPTAPSPPASRTSPRRNPRAVQTAGFITLPGAAELPQFESGTIVRVELPVASLPGYGVDISRAAGAGPVEADVLVGQDGQMRAIRLVTSRNSSSSPSSTSRSQQ